MNSIKDYFSLRFWSKRRELLHTSDVFCMAPWVHQYMFTDGKVFPCCISAHDIDENLGDLRKGETLPEIWNNEKTATLRKNMVNGQKK